jgi:lipopolysaccharide/colanic/teichoic acid biosynthesis glycosyltransferase
MIIKRIFDIMISLIGIIFLLPILILIAISIKLDSNGPIFFTQIRVGMHNKKFRIIKFRSMFAHRENIGSLISSGDDQRITRVGRILRKYKLDELPQLINVLKGEMSFVGPRPEIPKYVAAFIDDYHEILTVKPGITDFASLEYSNENELLKTDENPEQKYLEEILPIKIKYYKMYIKNKSFITDLKLIFKTIGKIVIQLFPNPYNSKQ